MRLRGIVTALLLATIFWGVIVWFVTAWAYPTEVNPQELHDKRTAAIRWHRQEERKAKERAEADSKPWAQGAADSAGGSSQASAPTPGPIAAYLRAAGFPESVIPTMVQIALRESGGNPRAVNPSSGACGLFQLYPCPGPEALDPWVNARLAFAKYQAAGLSPWGG